MKHTILVPSVSLTLTLIMICFVGNVVSSQPLETKLLAPDASAGDRFGARLSVDGNLAFIASPLDDEAGEDAGAIHVFRKIDGTWTWEDKLLAEDASAQDHFGSSLDGCGNTVVVGAPGRKDGGAAYVFVRTKSGWVQEARLQRSETDGAFGNAVALDDDTALIGAVPRGAYWFRRNSGEWALEDQVAPALDPRYEAGFAVDLNGEIAIVGIPASTAFFFEPELARIYRREGAMWIEEAELSHDRQDQSSDFFGAAVAIDGARALVGARWEDHLFRDNSGAAYAYRFDGESWSEEARFQTRVSADWFGAQVSLEEDTALIRTQLACRAYRRHEGNLIDFHREGMSFSDDVAISGDVLLIGASLDGERGLEAGAAYVLESADSLASRVDAISGLPTDVLFLNGETGGDDRTLVVAEDEPIALSVASPPADSDGRFVVYAHWGRPHWGTVETLPVGLGPFGFSFFGDTRVDAAAIWNNLGYEHLLGTSRFFDGDPLPDPGPAPETLFTLSKGVSAYFPSGTVVTFQGVIRDLGSTSPRLVSVTNGIVLEVL